MVTLFPECHPDNILHLRAGYTSDVISHNLWYTTLKWETIHHLDET